MKVRIWAGLSAAIAGMGLSLPALAFDHGCGDRAIECYDKVRLPDVYATRARPVVVAPGFREVVSEPPVVIDQPHPVVVVPGRWHAEHVPALYSTYRQRVLVAPARVTYSDMPAVTRTIRQEVVVHPGGTHWERSRGSVWPRTHVPGRQPTGHSRNRARGYGRACPPRPARLASRLS